MRSIGQALDVDNLLEGSVRKEGGNVRITTQLINANTGYHIWSKTYERKLTDVFAVQDEIAKSVADALQITLHVGDLAEIPGMTRNVDAWEEYLKGQAAMNSLAPDAFQKAAEHLERAVSLDPSFSLAWATSAPAYYYGAAALPERAAEWRQKAFDVVHRASEITPDAPFVVLGLADLGSFEGKWREAGAAFEQIYGPSAKAQPPDSAYRDYGEFYLEVGRSRDAIAPLERARPADPLNLRLAVVMGVAYSNAGRPDEAYAEFRRGAMLGGDRSSLDSAALVTALANRKRETIQEYLPKPDTAAPTAQRLDAALARFLDDPTGGRAEALRLSSDETVAQNPANFGTLAVWSAYFGDSATSLALIRKWYDSKITRDIVSRSLWNPIYRDMRKLPGFKALVREMGLVDYWRAYKWPDVCHPVGDDDFECG
jgi:tetratricopeptide (TPR) repeat protein